MEVALFFVAMLALWLWIRHDQRKILDSPAEPLARAKLKHGYVPGLSIKWLGFAGTSTLLAGVSLLHLLKPKSPPFTGRLSWAYAALYELFGKYGPGIALGLVAVAFALAAVSAYRATASQRKRQNAA